MGDLSQFNSHAAADQREGASCRGRLVGRK